MTEDYLGGDPTRSPDSPAKLMGKYEMGRLLGCGAFAKVYYARDLRTGQGVAIKVVSKMKVIKGGFTAHVKREIAIMRRLRHPNIVRLFEVMATKTKIYFVMEFAKGGELFAKIAKGRFNEDLCRKYFQQLISAVGYCHSRGVFHRDLKPENLLLDENWDLKVSDFGLSAVQDQIQPDGLLHTLCGTPAYVAPEILAKKGYDGAKVDVWTCGVILFVLNAGYLPFNDPNLMVMYRKIYRGEFRCPKWTPPDMKRLITRLLDTNPQTRITIDEILNDPWFRKGYRATKGHLYVEEFDWKDDEGGGDLDEEEQGKFMNAFGIISLSSGIDLTGLMSDESDSGRGAGGITRSVERYVSAEPADTIIEAVTRAGAEEQGVEVVRLSKGWGVRLEGQDGESVVVVRVHRLTDELVIVEARTREITGGNQGRDSRSSDRSRKCIWKDKLRPMIRAMTYRPEQPVAVEQGQTR
ncbi:hypothetical protein MLD38_030011 [Melastoma candidum]|uniref:Uncharacterized protein n=1 Tax=Melastoma candidum TaxID=119954 RepID=A0ACB9MLM2_9MYRT|nr:hypothetical protein MLD38_030011 [Melastoma candidum]